MKCNEDDTIGDLKKLIAAQVGTRPEKIRIQKWYTVYKVGDEAKGGRVMSGLLLPRYRMLWRWPDSLAHSCRRHFGVFFVFGTIGRIQGKQLMAAFRFCSCSTYIAGA